MNLKNVQLKFKANLTGLVYFSFVVKLKVTNSNTLRTKKKVKTETMNIYIFDLNFFILSS